MRTIAKLRYTTTLVGCAFFLSMIGVASAANFAGTWTFSAIMPNARTTPVCVFRQVGSRISGSCKGPNGIGSASGIVNGNAILFSWSHIPTNAIGMRGTATYHGVWGSDGVVRGTWVDSAIRGESGTFTGQKIN
jgi:hypothetical protein